VRSRVRSQLLGVHQPIYRATPSGAAGASYGRCSSGSNSETWGEENASASSIPAATGSPGTPPQTPIRAMSILRRRRVNSCGCSRLARTDRASDRRDGRGSILKNGAYDLAPLKRWDMDESCCSRCRHPCTPNLGLGGCMALEDALVLAKSFCKEASPNQLCAATNRCAAAHRHVQQRSLLMDKSGNGKSARRGGRQM